MSRWSEIQSKQNYCKAEGCNTKIHWKNVLYGTGMCSPCSHKGSRGSKWKGGICSKQYYCKICNKKIGYQGALYGSGLCQKCSCIGRKYPVGEKTSSYKDGRSLKKCYCKNCGKEIIYSTALFGSGLCKVCAFSGERHYNWQGGRSFEPYPPSFNRQLKERVRVRDNFICQKCRIPELECGECLTNHHIDYDKQNCKMNNLTSLCCSCNAKVNFNREKWTEYFMNKNKQNQKEDLKWQQRNFHFTQKRLR